jgi:hypothetical protein
VPLALGVEAGSDFVSPGRSLRGTYAFDTSDVAM